jgi:hypothetical protein
MPARPKLTAAQWLEVEALYRAGAQSNQQIAEAYGVSETAVVKKAKQFGWIRATGAARRQLVEGKLIEQRGEGADGVGLNLDLGALIELQAEEDARTLNEAALGFREGIQRARAMLPHVETPGALKTTQDALHVAAAGYIRVRRLDDRPADRSDFESIVRKINEEDQRGASRG